MKSEFCTLCLLIFLATGISVIMDPKDPPTLGGEDSLNFNEAFGVCVSKKEYGTFECINRGALSALQSLNDKDDLDFGEMRLERTEGYSRDLLDLDYDPKDFGNVIKAAARLMERRNMKWNLDNLYPGLQMRVGPMLNGDGVLEFVLNERAAAYGDRSAGTGRLLARHLLLPFLLGFKFNLASLIPLLFGIILLVTKKALLLTKVALFISGFLGWNSLFLGGTNPQPPTFTGFNPYGYEAPVGGLHYYEQFPHRPYRGIPGNDFGPYGQHVIREVVDVYEGAGDGQASRKSNNFVWTKE